MSKDVETNITNNENEAVEPMDVLQRLDQGQIDVEEAERLLAEHTPSADRDSDWSVSQDPLRARSWWLILFAIGFGFLVFGWGIATLGGWWWLLAAPLLLAGAVLALLGLGSMQSPWVHLRIFEGKGKRSHVFSIGLPIPIRFASWGLRNFGHYAPQLNRTEVDEILLALNDLESNLVQGPPIVVDITDGEDGEQIEVSMG
jgi:hypothetical protein